jgi:uncharacterized protein YbjT (DUF2867 family)
MILVVGATGQVGSAIVRGLRKRGAEVAALLRPASNADPLVAMGVKIMRGDLRDELSLRAACEGVERVVATANTIVPRPGERADFDAIVRGYGELGRLARAAGVRKFLFVSVPREFMDRGAAEFDAKARTEAALAADGPPLTVVRPSLIMEVWLPWLGTRLPLRGSKQATLERGFWLARVAGVVFQRSLDRFGVALMPGDGTARHAFIAVDDVADALVAAATATDGLPDELHLGGPEPISWREAAEAYGNVRRIRVRAVRQPAAPYRALSIFAAPLSSAASQLLASQAIVATVSSAYPPEDAKRLLGREPTSVEAFFRQRLASPAPG